MKQLHMPGVYADDDGGLHIDVAELLAGAGYPDTPENRATLLEAVRATFEGPITETTAPVSGAQRPGRHE